MLEFRLLGPLEMWVAGLRMDTGQPRHRLVLAALLTEVGRVASQDDLIDRVWRQMQAAERGGTAVSIARRSGGYVLEIGPDCVDVHRFRRMVNRGREPGCGNSERAGILRPGA